MRLIFLLPLSILLLSISVPAALAAQTPPVPSAQPGPPMSGPFTPFVTSTSATVMWISDSTPIRYGPLGQESEVHSFRMNRTQLNGLNPGSVIHYDIPGVGSGQFTTPPPPGAAANFNFVVFGDNRTRHDVYRQVAKEIAALKPTFIVHTGDLVENGLNPALWSIFFDISRDLLRNAAFFTTLGNHEGNSPYWYQFFDQHTGYYSFDWGKTHWAMLNTNNVPPDPEAYWAQQLAWLEKDLEKNQGADFLFVAFHHTPYTAVKNRQAAAARIAARLVPIFKKYKVSAIFAGHDHNYQHHEEGGIPYIVTGGGGAPLYDVDGIMDITVKAEKVENYVLCRTLAAAIRCEARALGGRVIERFDLGPRKVTASAPVSPPLD